MKKNKILLILLSIALVITPFCLENVFAKEEDEEFVLLDASFALGMGNKNLGNTSKSNVCYSSGCRNSNNPGIRVTIKDASGTKSKDYSCSSGIACGPNNTVTMIMAKYFIDSINTEKIAKATEEFANEISGKQLQTLTDLMDLVNKLKSFDYYKIIKEVNPNASIINATNTIAQANEETLKLYADGCDNQYCPLEKFFKNTYANALEKTFIVVEPIATLTIGSSSWWLGDNIIYDDKTIVYTGLDGTKYAIDLETAKEDAKMPTCVSGNVSACLGSEYYPMWRILGLCNSKSNPTQCVQTIQKYNKYINNQLKILEIAIGVTAEDIAKARKTEIDNKYRNAIKEYNNYVQWLKSLGTIPDPGTLSKNSNSQHDTIKNLASKFAEQECHVIGYKNGTKGNCSNVVSGSASSWVNDISMLLHTEKSLGGYTGVTTGTSKWSIIANPSSGYGVNVFNVKAGAISFGAPGACRYENGKLEIYDLKKGWTSEGADSCCEYEINTSTGLYNWTTRDAFNIFKKSSKYSTYCPLYLCDYDTKKEKLTPPLGKKEEYCCTNDENQWKTTSLFSAYKLSDLYLKNCPSNFCEYDPDKMTLTPPNGKDDEYCCLNDTSQWETTAKYKTFTNTSKYKEICTENYCKFDLNSKKITIPSGKTEEYCCFNDKNQWEKESEYKTFIDTDTYDDLCGQKLKCTWTSKTSTKKIQLVNGETMDCCDINNYTSKPNTIDWNQWHKNNCEEITYTCTLSNIPSITSEDDPCCKDMTLYSREEQNKLISSGGIKGYLEKQAPSVLGICYPSSGCVVTIDATCPNCYGNAEGTIADHLAYFTTNANIADLNYDEPIKKCIIGQSELRKFNNNYCEAYCGEKIEYEYPAYGGNKTELAGTKITVGKDGTFSPITLTGTKKCFVKEINSKLFKSDMSSVEDSIKNIADQIDKYYRQIDSIKLLASNSSSCDFVYYSNGISGCRSSHIDGQSCYDQKKDLRDKISKDDEHLANCVSKYTGERRETCIDKYSTNKSRYQSELNALENCQDTYICDLPDNTKYDEYVYYDYVNGNGKERNFCSNNNPKQQWETELKNLRISLSVNLRDRNGFINAMNDCMDITRKVNYSEFDPSLYLDYEAGKYNVQDIELNKDLIISEFSGSVGEQSEDTVSYSTYDSSTGKLITTNTMHYGVLEENDTRSHEFQFKKEYEYFLGNNFDNYTYVDLTQGESMGTWKKTSVRIGAHLPIPYNSQETNENNKVAIKTTTFGSGNRLNNELENNKECKEYECKFIVYNDLIDDKGLRVVYRPISLTNPFPEEDGKGRATGTNWCDGNDCSHKNNVVTKVITNNRGVKEEAIYAMTPLYTIKLTPATILSIRAYNLLNQYGDFNFDCIQSNGSYKCKSDFLRNTYNSILIEDESCALGSGANCWKEDKY